MDDRSVAGKQWRERVDHPPRLVFQIDAYAAAVERVPVRVQPFPKEETSPVPVIHVDLPEAATLARSTGEIAISQSPAADRPAFMAMAHHAIERCR